MTELRELISRHRPVEPYVGYHLTQCMCGEYVGPGYEDHLASVIEEWHRQKVQEAMMRQWKTLALNGARQ